MPFQEKNPELSGFLTFKAEITDPGIAGADQARLYISNTGGKTQLVIVFASGAVQQIAVEP